MKSLQKWAFSTERFSSRGTWFPAISRRVRQKFARNSDFGAGTLGALEGRRLTPLVTILREDPAYLRGAVTPWRAQDQRRKRIGMERRFKK